MAGQPVQPSASDRRTLLLTISKFAGGNLVGNGLTILSGFLVARSVGPDVLGLFNSIGLVLGYAPWLLLGVGNGLGRELPYWMGKGDRDRAVHLTAVAQAWSLGVAGVCAAVLLGVAFWQAFHARWDLAFGWFVNAVAVWVLIFGANYLRFTYRSTGDFTRLAKVQVTQGILGLVLVGAVALMGFFGLCLRALIQVGAQLGQLWHWRPLKVRAVWSTPGLLHLMKVGLPIMFVGQLSAWWGVLNDTLVLKHLDTVSLGLNALVMMGTRPLSILTDAVSGVVYPRMTSEFARTGDLRQALRVAALPALVLLPIIVALVAVGWWVAPPLVALLLPKYTAAVPALQWNLLALIPLSFSSFNNIFAASGRMMPYALSLVGGVVAYLIALHVLLDWRQDLVTFAQAMVLGRTVFLLLAFASIGLILTRGRRKAADAV